MGSEALTVHTPQVLDRVEKPVVITGDQVDLIKATIAADATDAELALFFYDCRRRGVHPLDRLLHFTKRGGKYTPITAIDFFRARAAATREHMGTEDAVFDGEPQSTEFKATVTVYRLVQGEKCPFTASARWTEYCPEEEKNAFMWRKMPHGQLAKVCEALALRKGFPQELEGLHTIEEMDQAADDPRPTKMQPPQRKAAPATSAPATNGNHVTGKVQAIDKKDGEKKGKAWTKFSIKVDDKWHATFDTKHRDLAQEAREAGLNVTIEFRTTDYGRDILTIAIVEVAPVEQVKGSDQVTSGSKAATANGQLPIDREPGAEG